MRKRRGIALLFVAALTGLLLLIAIAAGVNSISSVNITNEERMRTKLQFACESGLNRARVKIEQSFNNSNLNNLEPFVTFQGNAADDTGDTPEEKAYNDELFVSSATDYYTFTLNTGADNPDIIVRYSIDNGREDDDDGWLRSEGFTTNQLAVEAIAYIPGGGWIGMNEEVFARRTSLFMYQIFFENELEIAPGPTFNLRGLIHSNKDIYLNSGNNLNVYTDSLTSAGNIYRGRLDSTSVGGSVNISENNEDGNLVTMNNNEDSDNEDWVDIATQNWGGTVKDSSLGATRQEAPDLKSFEPDGYYSENAGISVKVDTSGAQTLYSIEVDGSSVGTYTAAQTGGALEETIIYDYRENPSGSNPANNEQTKITNLDINKLEALVGSSSNGVVYMSRDDAIPDTDGDEFSPDPSRNVSGFKLVNSSTLNNPTTFVSDNPVYIQGDFNLHTSSDPAADSWKPCAVVADAITLLSNSWQDSASNWKDPAVDPNKKLPTASNTEYNLVLITGNVPTKPGQYSGGLENFPRFLESWSGKSVDISGGFVQLFRSKFATGKWGYGSYYKAPTRNWGSESRFTNLNDLPPEFVDMFPSASVNIIYSGWGYISKSDSEIGAEVD